MEQYHALPDYYEILKGKKEPAYLKCKRVPVEYDPDGPLETLWKAHEGGMAAYREDGRGEEAPPVSLLDLKQTIEELVTYNASYILSEHLFLRGDQKNIFFSFIKTSYPDLLPLYTRLFKDAMTPSTDYTKPIDKKIKKICGTHQIPTELPL